MLGTDRKILQPTRIINLFQYASGKEKKVEVGNQQKLKSSSKISKNWSYGLDTLMHFNDSANLSSIRSFRKNQSRSESEGQQSNRYQQYIDEAKLDIQNLKSKRLKFEKQWKGKKNCEKAKYQGLSLDESLAESQVSPYDYSSQLQTYDRPNPHEKIKEKDRFIEQLRRQMQSQKIIQFTKKIKRYSFGIFLKQLKVCDKVIAFQKNYSFRYVSLIFNEWKEFSLSLQQRKKIRVQILKRIQQKRKKHIEDDFDAAQFYLKET